jgi:hypothetical protein
VRVEVRDHPQQDALARAGTSADADAFSGVEAQADRPHMKAAQRVGFKDAFHRCAVSHAA